MSSITIYFDNKPVFLCDALSDEIEEYRHHPDAVYIDEISTPAINALLHEIEKERFHAGIIIGKNLALLKKDFFKHFHLIQAAGGAVINENGKLLMIFRRGKWDLPKGKLDENETIEQCALREVSEETGLRHIDLVKFIGITYHTYVLFGKHNLKETHWYEMKGNSNEKLIPQFEEEITEIIWVEKDDLTSVCRKTFPTIKWVVEKL